MTLLILIATHGLAVAIGVYGGRALTLKGARTWPDPPHLLEDVMHHRDSARRTAIDNSEETPQEGKARRNLRDNGRLSLVLLLAGLFIIVIGAQAYLDGRDNAADQERVDTAVAKLETTTACVKTWGENFADATTARVGSDSSSSAAPGSIDLEKAEARRDDALDEIILTVIAAREIPPTADTEDFDRVLEEYATAIRQLEKIRRDVDVTRALNEYPDLDC